MFPKTTLIHYRNTIKPEMKKMKVGALRRTHFEMEKWARLGASRIRRKWARQMMKVGALMTKSGRAKTPKWARQITKVRALRRTPNH